jgi:formylglycine-generating enzyme required for sulfatase activity
MQYQEFVIQTKTLVAPHMGWEGQAVPRGKENHPVTGVTWYEALAYCQWLKEKTEKEYSLPSEAQWEKACRADSKNLYPWGDEFDDQRCNHSRSHVAPVDAYSAQSAYGCYDLVGNVRQWTCTLWGKNRITPDPEYAYPWKNNNRNDLNANRQIRRVVRGSAMKDGINMHRCSARSGQVPDDRGLPGARHSFRVVIALS